MSSSKNRTLLTFLGILSLTACEQSAPRTHDSSEIAQGATSLDELLAQASNDANRADVISGIKALQEKRLQDASRAFNTALLDDPTNSYLHTLNGICYHLMAKNGNMEGFDLAEAGYIQAKKFDPSNTFAALQLGRIKADKQDYRAAQEEFAQSLLLDPTNESALYELTSVSYQMGDLKTARMGVKRLLRAQPQNANYLRTASLIAAAANNPEQAQEYQTKYNKVVQRHKDKAYLARRIEDWHRTHEAGFHLTQAAGEAAPPATPPEGAAPAAPNFDTGAGAPPPAAPPADPTAAAAAPGAAPAGMPAAPGAPAPAGNKNFYDDMIVVDVVVMRVSESGSTQKGNNILENFTATLAPFNYFSARNATGTFQGSMAPSGSGIPPSGFSQTTFPTVTSMNANPHGHLRMKTFALSTGTFNYSLKIANVRDEYIQVIGRPTLTASIGKAAEFYSGDDIKVALSGNFGGNVTNTPTGFTLNVTPLSLEDDIVTLDCNVQGSLFGGSLDELFADQQTGPKPFRVLNSRTKTTVKVRRGETIMLAGILERVENSDHGGVPLLKDLPGIQYFFSEENTASSRKSIVYLLTPRAYADTVKETKAYFLSGEDFGERPTLKEFEMKYKDWYDPASNQIHVLEHLGPNYQNFRNGDVPPLQWSHHKDLEAVLTQIIDSLWF